MALFPSVLLTLTDTQISTIMAHAGPLPADARSAFFEAIAVRLATVPEIGDGSVARVCRETQRAYFDPPDLSRSTGLRGHERRG
jgi:hypothetical protein